MLPSTAGDRVHPTVWFVCQWDFVGENELFLCWCCLLEELLSLGGGLCPLSLSALELHLVYTCSGSMPAFTVTVSSRGHQSCCVKKVLCPWCPLSPLILKFSLCLFFGSVPWVPREGFDGNIPFRTDWSVVSHSLSDCMTDWECLNVWLWVSSCIPTCS